MPIHLFNESQIGMDANRNGIKKRKNAFSVLFQKDPKQRRLKKKRKSTSGKGKLQIDAECPVCFGLFDLYDMPYISSLQVTEASLPCQIGHVHFHMTCLETEPVLH